MASSSCFPAGFEPIIYPRDFSYAARDDVKKKKGLDCSTLEQAMIITDYNKPPQAAGYSIGLMDGGVDDNQGVYSAMLADKRRRLMTFNGFDLVIVSDVASYFHDPYVPPSSVETGSYRKKNLASMGGGCGRLSQTELDPEDHRYRVPDVADPGNYIVGFCRAGRLDESWLSPSVACHPGVSAGGAGHRIQGRQSHDRKAGRTPRRFGQRAGRFLKGRAPAIANFSMRPWARW